jgi:hypothetical protein
MKYLALFALLAIFGVWGWTCDIARKKRVARLKALADMACRSLGGRSVLQWLDILNKDTAQILVANESGVLNVLGRAVLLIDGETSFTTFGRFGALRGQSLALFLVAVDADAVGTLKAHRREFKWLCGSAECAAFAIRRLEDVIAMSGLKKA